MTKKSYESSQEFIPTEHNWSEASQKGKHCHGKLVQKCCFQGWVGNHEKVNLAKWIHFQLWQIGQRKCVRRISDVYLTNQEWNLWVRYNSECQQSRLPRRIGRYFIVANTRVAKYPVRGMIRRIAYEGPYLTFFPNVTIDYSSIKNIFSIFIFQNKIDTFCAKVCRSPALMYIATSWELPRRMEESRFSNSEKVTFRE